MSKARGGPAIRVALTFAMIAALTAIIAPTAAFAADPDHVGQRLEGCDSDSASGNYVPNPFIGAVQPKTAFVCDDSLYGTGNMGKDWNELDLVPFRLTMDAGNAAPASQTYTVGVALDGEDAGHPGYDVLTIPTLNEDLSANSCNLDSVGPQQNKNPGFGGTDITIYRLLTISQSKNTECVLDFDGRIAVGAHLFPGASLHANTTDEAVTKTNQDRSISVNEIAPQSIEKDMTASRGSDFTWNVTKSPTPTSLDFGDTCPTGDVTLSDEVDITVEWTKLAATPSGDVTVVTNIYATNPAHRVITVNVTDDIFEGAGQTTLFDTENSSDVDVPAETANFLILTHTVTGPSSATSFNDVATATYTDKDTGVPVPGTTEATASALVQDGSATNGTAVITDVEDITGTGLTYSVDEVDGLTSGFNGDFNPAYTLGTATDGSVTWVSDTQSDDGSVTFTKTVYFDGPGDTSGMLSDTATLDGSDDFEADASLDVDIDAHTEAVLTINKSITVPADGNLNFV